MGGLREILSVAATWGLSTVMRANSPCSATALLWASLAFISSFLLFVSRSMGATPASTKTHLEHKYSVKNTRKEINTFRTGSFTKNEHNQGANSITKFRKIKRSYWINLLNGCWCSNKQLPAMPNSTCSTRNCNISKISVLRSQGRYHNILMVTKGTIFHRLVPRCPFWLGKKIANWLESLPTAQ